MTSDRSDKALTPSAEEDADLGVRSTNLEQVLAVLLQLEPEAFATREDLVKQTGLAHATIGRALRRLRDRPDVVEFAQSQTSARTAESLRLKEPPGFVVGLEFSHHKVTAALGDLRAQIGVGHWDIRNGLDFDVDSHPDAAIALGAQLVKHLVGERDPRELVGIGLAIAAPIDVAPQDQPRRVRGLGGPGSLKPSSWVNRFPARELREQLPRDWDCPIEVDNDVNLAALDEFRWSQRYWAGALNYMVHLKWASGVGGGLILDGRIYRGSGGFAGEIGHSPIPNLADIDRPKKKHGEPQICQRCGREACLESVISYDRMREVIGHNVSRDTIDESDAGQELIARYSRYLGSSLSPLVNALSPQLLVVSGPTEAVRDIVLFGVREGLSEYAAPAIREEMQVRLAEQRWEQLGDTGARFTVVTGAMHRVLALHAPAYLRRLVDAETSATASGPKIDSRRRS